MEEAITFAKKYLEDVLSFFGLNVDVHATHDDDVIELNIPSTHLNGFLIGQRGDTVRALQYMVASALKNKKFEYVRVNVDVADYKRAQNERLADQVELWSAEVKASKKDLELRPMNSASRRIVHKVASENGLETESVGEGLNRRVIIKSSGYDDDSGAKIEDQETSKSSKGSVVSQETTSAKKAKTETKESRSVVPKKETNIKKPAKSLAAKLLKPRDK